MREKIYNVLNKVYGAVLIVAFFAGILPVIPFVVALIVGGETAEAICLFLYDDYYKWVIAASAISVIIGWVAIYFKKSDKTKKKNKEDKNASADVDSEPETEKLAQTAEDADKTKG